MQITQTFKNGDSLAVHIPTALAYGYTDVALEIERIGDELRIRPARQTLAGVLDIFARFSPDFMQEGRGVHEQQERQAL